MRTFAIGLALAIGCVSGGSCAESDAVARSQYDAMVARHAHANGVPEALVHRIIMRESRYNPRARNGPYWGMMQLSMATARGAGYRGAPAGLLDADTNLAYGVRYLAGAYKTAGGDHDRAVGFYARGYYYAAKRQGMLAAIGLGRDGRFSSPAPSAAGTAGVTPAVATVASASAAPAPAAAPVRTAFVPLPPVRGAAPAAAPTTQTASAAPAQAAVPLPPIRGASPAAAPARTVAAIQPPRQRDEPETTGSVATGRPAPTQTARSGARQPVPAGAPQLAAATPLPAPRDADASAAKSPRTVAVGAAPALASAGPIAPARTTPTPTPGLSYAEPQRAIPTPLSR